MTRYLLIFLLCLSASAQTTLKGVHLYGKATFTGMGVVPPLTNLYRFWTYETLPIGITVSNQWNDIMVNAPLWQMDTSLTLPTNTASGVRFAGGNTKLTNSAIASNGRSCWMVVSFENPADTPGLCFAASGSYGAQITAASKFYMFGTPAITLSSALPNTNIVDYVLVSSVGGFTLFTNGTFSATVDGGGNDFTADIFGNRSTSTTSGLKGYLINYAWYSNRLTTNDAVALHQWRTNRYGGSP